MGGREWEREWEARAHSAASSASPEEVLTVAQSAPADVQNGRCEWEVRMGRAQV